MDDVRRSALEKVNKYYFTDEERRWLRLAAESGLAVDDRMRKIIKKEVENYEKKTDKKFDTFNNQDGRAQKSEFLNILAKNKDLQYCNNADLSREVVAIVKKGRRQSRNKGTPKKQPKENVEETDLMKSPAATNINDISHSDHQHAIQVPDVSSFEEPMEMCIDNNHNETTPTELAIVDVNPLPDYPVILENAPIKSNSETFPENVEMSENHDNYDNSSQAHGNNERAIVENSQEELVNTMAVHLPMKRMPLKYGSNESRTNNVTNSKASFEEPMGQSDGVEQDQSFNVDLFMNQKWFSNVSITNDRINTDSNENHEEVENEGHLRQGNSQSPTKPKTGFDCDSNFYCDCE